MAAGNSKGGLAHRSKAVPKKTDAKSLKRKRGQEDLGKLKAAVDELVSPLFSRSPSIVAVALTSQF